MGSETTFSDVQRNTFRTCRVGGIGNFCNFLWFLTTCFKRKSIYGNDFFVETRVRYVHTIQVSWNPSITLFCDEWRPASNREYNQTHKADTVAKKAFCDHLVLHFVTS